MRLRVNKSPKLADFPLKLRKLAFEIADSDRQITLKKACERENVNYKSARTMIWKCKKKGKDFYELVNEISSFEAKLEAYRYENELFEKALEGSYKHMKLFYKRLGLLGTTRKRRKKQNCPVCASLQGSLK